MKSKSNLPNTFLVGAAKCGTTSLADYMSQHPEICQSDRKEPFYFIDDIGVSSLMEYESLFPGGSYKVSFEASTGYLFRQEACTRIKRYCPDAKIIIMLRNPVDMAFSYWRYMSLVGNESLSFDDAIADELSGGRMTDGFRSKCKNWPDSYLYVARAMYFQQVKNYVETFGEDNVKVIFFEEFKEGPLLAMQELFSFLGVDDQFQPVLSRKNEGGVVRSRLFRDFVVTRPHPFLRSLFSQRQREVIRSFIKRINTRKSNDRMSNVSRGNLESLFRCDIESLEDFLGKDIGFWKK